MEPFMTTLGERIKDLRKKARMSQKELALKVGVEGGSLGNWERDNREPSISYIAEINEVLKPILGDNLFYLITGKRPEEHINAITIKSSYISREVVLDRTEKFLSDMDLMREIRIVGKMDDVVKAFADSVLKEPANNLVENGMMSGG
tara:strand:+ start:3837 stop:4277 length:441 start_codon:yes stop_codon:yes gene_type:complete